MFWENKQEFKDIHMKVEKYMEMYHLYKDLGGKLLFINLFRLFLFIFKIFNFLIFNIFRLFLFYLNILYL